MNGRERLAGQQAELLKALLADGEIPPGFDEDRVQAERIVLRSKRKWVTGFLRPDLRRELGTRYTELFDAYAVTHPRAEGIRAHQDADAFGEWLIEQGELKAPKRPWWSPRRWIASR
ncbi:MAG: hypothetical protein QOI21_3327 [Actinomycetota bacterium]|jgi:hypothetical protein|nr:hypothetical protein [Actinomycetota bacterium]